jgi:hypothetical protein
MVHEICRDIRQLDNAKRHLQTTITALKRLHMLVTAVDQLKIAAKNRQFREAANLLDAVRQLLTHFETYSSVPRISELRSVVSSIRSDLTAEVHRAFEAVGQLAASTADPESFEREEVRPGEFRSLGEAALVVDALGSTARERQVSSFCAAQMKPYEGLFPKNGPESGLEGLERRFAWFRRLLRSVDDRFESILPAHWRLQHRLCLLFLERTRAALLDVLSAEDSEAPDVQVLLRALQKCLTFEKDAMSRFGSTCKEADDAISGLGAGGGGMDSLNVGSAEEIRHRHQMLTETARRKESSSYLKYLSKDGQGARDEEEEPLLPIMGALSSVFDPFMGPYIEFERGKLEEILRSAPQADEEGIDHEGKVPVFSTSISMFVYIRNSIQRCTRLTTGQTFFKLFKAFKACLGDYARNLQAKFPPSAGTGVLGTNQYKITEGGQLMVCYVVNTCEYCSEILPQLEDTIKSKIDEAYKDSIDLTYETDAYHDTISVAIRVLHGGLEHRADPACRSMSSINWGSCDTVGEESSYVRAIGDAIMPYIPILRKLMSTLYFRAFCDKFANSFLPAFLNLLLKQRRISEAGSQQLLLDVYNLKNLMLKLPAVGLEDEGSGGSYAPPSIIPLSYTKFVTAQMSKIEMVLKLVGTPDALLVERFRIMWPDGSAEDIQGVMNLKGMKRVDQSSVLQTLGLQPGVGAPASGGTSSPREGSAGRSSLQQFMRSGAEEGSTGSARFFPVSSESTRDIANKVESSMRTMTSNFRGLSFGRQQQQEPDQQPP